MTQYKIEISKFGKDFHLKNPWTVDVEYDTKENMYTANIDFLRLYGEGNNEKEALDMLERNIILFYYDIMETPNDELSKRYLIIKNIFKFDVFKGGR